MTDAATVAQRLVAEHGPPEAWQHATREAIDAHLRHDAGAAAHWSAVLRALRDSAPRPGAGDEDIYRSARNLIGGMGAQEAWRYAVQQGVEVEGDLLQQTYWARVADAVHALAQGFGREGA